MGCTGECPSDNGCPTNGDCSGHQPTCGINQTSWAESIVAGTTLIKASHVVELQNAIIAERTDVIRRGTSLACGTNCSDVPSFTRVPAVGNTIQADDLNDIASANNTTEYNVNCPSDSGAAETPAIISSNVSVGAVIYKADIDALRAEINAIEYACICNSYCNCNYNCGCDGECPSDGTPY
jgi:hypothetical protein